MSSPEKERDRYSYSDYLAWPDDERWELIDGLACNMTPAPTPRHQKVAARFYSRLELALEGKPCTPFIAPADVVLSEHDVVQPDVFVICDEQKITRTNIRGVPDLVVEVASPSTAMKDRRDKKNLYERHGVAQYVIIDPEGEYLECFTLQADGSYGKSEILAPEDTLTLLCVGDGQINLWEVFEKEPPESIYTE
jgi:Uma2 family endonuclease